MIIRIVLILFSIQIIPIKVSAQTDEIYNYSSDIQLQIDNGAWSTIINQVDLSNGAVEWTTGNISSKAKFRVKVNGQYIASFCTKIIIEE